MQNRKLFEAIEKLVEEKTYQMNNIKGKPNFVMDYCNQQLIKKKLIPKDPRIKINRLMKKFEQVATFVNGEELINCLNSIQKREEKISFPVTEKSIGGKIETHKRYDSEGASSMDQIKSNLKNFYKERNLRETEKMRHIMKEL